MAFEKGHKKTGGRKKGGKNKLTKVADELIDFALAEDTGGLKHAWHELKPKEKWDVAVKLLPFKKAMMARVDGEGRQIPNVTVNLIAAQGDSPKQLDNTISIDHEEVE